MCCRIFDSTVTSRDCANKVDFESGWSQGLADKNQSWSMQRTEDRERGTARTREPFGDSQAFWTSLQSGKCREKVSWSLLHHGFDLSGFHPVSDS